MAEEPVELLTGDEIAAMRSDLESGASAIYWEASTFERVVATLEWFLALQRAFDGEGEAERG